MNVDTGSFRALTDQAAEAGALRDENDGMRRALDRVFRYGMEAGLLIATGEPPQEAPQEAPPRRRDHLTVVR